MMAAIRSRKASAPARSAPSASMSGKAAFWNARPIITGGAREVFGGPWLDRVEFLDYGTNPSDWLAAAEAGEIDLLYESVGDFIDAMNAHRLDPDPCRECRHDGDPRLATRRDDGPKPYRNTRLRRALALAVDNAICLELGYAGRGMQAHNDHVSPIHPAHADIGPVPNDPAKARGRTSSPRGFSISSMSS